MLNLIFQKAKTDKTVIVDSRRFFFANKKEEWFQDKVVQNIMWYVDNAKLVEGFCIRDRLGKIVPPEYLSTGCKTAILVWLYPEKVFNMTQCGNNAFKCVSDICVKYDRTELTYRFLPLRFLKNLKLQKDGVDITLDEYDELVDDWLEEIMND